MAPLDENCSGDLCQPRSKGRRDRPDLTGCFGKQRAEPGAALPAGRLLAGKVGVEFLQHHGQFPPSSVGEDVTHFIKNEAKLSVLTHPDEQDGITDAVGTGAVGPPLRLRKQPADMVMLDRLGPHERRRSLRFACRQ